MTNWARMLQDKTGHDPIPEPVARAIYDHLYHPLFPGQEYSKLLERGGFGWGEIREMARMLKAREGGTGVYAPAPPEPPKKTCAVCECLDDVTVCEKCERVYNTVGHWSDCIKGKKCYRCGRQCSTEMYPDTDELAKKVLSKAPKPTVPEGGEKCLDGKSIKQERYCNYMQCAHHKRPPSPADISHGTKEDSP